MKNSNNIKKQYVRMPFDNSFYFNWSTPALMFLDKKPVKFLIDKFLIRMNQVVKYTIN